MKTNFLFLAAFALVLGACNGHKTVENTTTVTSTDTTSVNSSTDTTSVSKTGNAKTTSMGISDTAFLIKAYNTGVFEIRASKLAKRMTEHKKVKEFANMIITDHAAMDSNVAAMLTQRGCAIPTDLPDDLKAKMKELNEYMGKDFEQRYAQANIDGHKDAIALFSDVSKNSKDAAVRKLATDALPNLQMHEVDADSLLVFINTPKKW